MSKSSLVAAFHQLPEQTGRKLTLDQQMVALREENSSLKDVVEDISVKFDKVQRQQQQMQEVIVNQQQTMARQHKELMTLLKKQKRGRQE